jgi:hypothetical protein
VGGAAFRGTETCSLQLCFVELTCRWTMKRTRNDVGEQHTWSALYDLGGEKKLSDELILRAGTNLSGNDCAPLVDYATGIGG